MTVFVGRKPILHNEAGKADFTPNAIGRAISQITHLRFLSMATPGRRGAKQNISVYQLMASSVGMLIRRSLSQSFEFQWNSAGLGHVDNHY